MPGPPDPWQFAVSVIGFIAVAYQLSVEPRRQRRAAAIEAFRGSQELREKLRKRLPHPINDIHLQEFVRQVVDEVREHRELTENREALRAYLNYWETMATGTLRGVLDFTVLTAISGDRLKEMRKDYEPYIKAVQEVEQSRSYEQLTFLVDHVLSSRLPRLTLLWYSLSGNLPGRRAR